MTVLLDAFCVIALLRDEPAAGEVETLLRRGDAAVMAINLAEALDVLQRVEGVSRERLDDLTGSLTEEALTVLPVDEGIARDAAEVRARRYHRARAPLSLADCVLIAAAGDGDTIATADGPLLRAARAERVAVISLPDGRGRRSRGG